MAFMILLSRLPGSAAPKACCKVVGPPVAHPSKPRREARPPRVTAVTPPKKRDDSRPSCENSTPGHDIPSQ
jgi:hypothetical protein